MTMGDWLVDKGLDAPRAPRLKTPSMNALRRAQGGHPPRGAPFGPPHASMLGSARAGMGRQVRQPCPGAGSLLPVALGAPPLQQCSACRTRGGDGNPAA